MKRILEYNRLNMKTISFQIIGNRTIIPTITNITMRIVNNIFILLYQENYL